MKNKIEDTKIVLGIRSANNSFELKIDYATQKAILNGENFNMNIKPFVSKLMCIVSSWEKEMKTPSMDGISYYVHIKKDGKTYNFDGLNKFPDNFDEFLYLLYKENVCEPLF